MKVDIKGVLGPFTHGPVPERKLLFTDIRG